MNRMVTGLLGLTILAGSWAGPLAAQTVPVAAPPAPAAPAAPVWQAGPASALAGPAAALPPPAEAPPHLPGPYFEFDPLLDHPRLPPLGWFSELDVALLDVHLKRQSFNTPPNNLPNNGFVPQGQFDLAVSPRLQVGYRLPAGFGEVSLTGRLMSTEGGATTNQDGLTNLRDRLDVNFADLDYASNEISLWPSAEMRWRLGLRLAEVYFDSRQSTPFGLPVPAGGITDRRFTNWFWGIGPVYGLQLIQRLEGWDCSLLFRIDGASLFGRINEGYSQDGTPDAKGASQRARARFASSQDVPTLNVQLGFLWRPRPALDVFVGYQYESWWNVGRLGVLDSRGEFFDQGFVARLGLSW